MLGKISKVLKNQKGFTLIELMTVLIILGVVLGIGIPKYLQVQAKAEWEADVGTITNFARAAEVYAASINEFGNGDSTGVTIQDLVDADLIDEDTVLNRRNSGKNELSEKNKGADGEKTVAEAYGEVITFTFDTTTGNVNNLSNKIQEMIGNPPYGDGPVFPGDKNPVWGTTP